MFVFGGFSQIVKLRPDEVSIDNLLFKLHYRFTFALLVACTILVSSRQFIKEHIQCLSESSVSDVINTFCFFSSTFTVARYHNDSYLPGIHIASPGVGPVQSGDEVTHHAYYQWVPFVLFGQAIMFYLPHYIWKSLEKGRIRAIVDQVKTSIYTAETDTVINGYKIDSKETWKNREKLCTKILISWARLQVNRDWAKHFIFCEFLNIINILFQIMLVDSFLQGNFLDLGIRWIRNDQEVLDSVFPKLTKCTFHKFGQSGSIQNHDALCVMSLNIINEKVYTMLWFWFLILLFLTVLGMLWRLLTFLLHSKSGTFNRYVWGEVSPGPALKAAEIEIIATKLSFSDWLFLYYIGRNIDPRMFRMVVADLGQTLGKPLLSIKGSDASNLASESYC